LTTLAFTGTAMPGFFFALFLIYLVALRLDLLPPGGIFTAGGSNSFGDRLEHMILPAIALSVDGLGGLLRYTRASLSEVLDQEYVSTARAKGLSERIVIVRHAFRNALLPLITLTGLRIPALLSGAVLIESVFNYPGIGLTIYRATATRDYPLLMAGVLVSATAVLLANLIADLAYAWADPRIRYT
jgi:peptide/nickel transport system permease protein